MFLLSLETMNETELINNHIKNSGENSLALGLPHREIVFENKNNEFNVLQGYQKISIGRQVAMKLMKVNGFGLRHKKI